MKARFHLPGLRLNFPLNMIFLGLLKQFPEYFRDGIEIASFFGEFPMSLWNGGRLVLHDQCDEKFIRQAVKTINGQGVPVRFTYTNPLLTKEDLEDPYCNFCMQVADNGMNEVMVYSPILEEYIRILRCALLTWVKWVKGTFFKFSSLVKRINFFNFLFVYCVNFLNFVACSKSVKKVNKRHTSL